MNRNYRVLITDDDKDIHDVLNTAFQSLDKKSKNSNSLKNNLLDQLSATKNEKSSNIDIDHAYQGQEAISILQDDSQPKVDLLILDMLMPPGINGAQVMKELGEHSKDLKIIISTAYFHDLEDEIRKMSESFESVHLLLKPYNLNTFSELVNNVLFEKGSYLENENILKLK